jgi:Resolvase, N terminal domain
MGSENPNRKEEKSAKLFSFLLGSSFGAFHLFPNTLWRLDRAGRSLKHLIELLKSLQERGIEFMSLGVS